MRMFAFLPMEGLLSDVLVNRLSLDSDNCYRWLFIRSLHYL